MKRKSSKIIKTDNNLRYTEAFVIVSASETISSARCSEKIKIHGDVRITKAKPIMPDIFIPRDTTGLTASFNYLVNHALMYQFALQYTDYHRKEMKQYKNWKDLTQICRNEPFDLLISPSIHLTYFSALLLISSIFLRFSH